MTARIDKTNAVRVLLTLSLESRSCATKTGVFTMPSPTKFSYTIRDESGDKATSLLYVAYDAATETVAALLGAAAAFGGLIDAVTGGVITEFNVTIPALPDPAWKDNPDADSDVQKTLLENFTAADTLYPQEFIVPALKGSLVDVNGHPILTSGGAIDAMNDAIVAGSGAVFPNNQFLLDLTALRDAAVTFRKRKDSRKLSKVRV